MKLNYATHVKRLICLNKLLVGVINCCIYYIYVVCVCVSVRHLFLIINKTDICTELGGTVAVNIQAVFVRYICGEGTLRKTDMLRVPFPSRTG